MTIPRAFSTVGLACWLSTAAVAQPCEPDWFPVGGLPSIVFALAIFDDDGPGPNPPALFAGGQFQEAGPDLADNVAKWDGSQWRALGSGTNSPLRALAVFDEDGDGPGPPALFAAGLFTTAGGTSWSCGPVRETWLPERGG